jgi:hypothetical protein
LGHFVSGCLSLRDWLIVVGWAVTNVVFYAKFEKTKGRVADLLPGLFGIVRHQVSKTLSTLFLGGFVADKV